MSEMTEIKKTDKRVQRTQLALRNAFVDLVLCKSYDEITLNDIIAKANIGRSTFYQHYSSKDDILAKSLAYPMSVIANALHPDSSTEQLSGIVQHFWEKRSFARVIFNGTPRKHVINTLICAIEKQLKSYYSKQQSKLLVPYHLAAIMLAEAQLALLVGWLTGQGHCPTEKLVAALDAASKGLRQSLETN